MSRIFNGTTSTSTVSDPSTDMDGFQQTAFSYGAWIDPNSDGEGSTGRIVLSRSATLNKNLLFVKEESAGSMNLNIIVVNSGTNSDSDTSTRPIDIGIWNHVITTTDGIVTSAPKIFVAGIDETVILATGSGSIDNNDGAFFIGNAAAPTRTFDGELSHITIWKAELSAAEITALSRGVNPFGIRPDTLVLLAPFWGNQDPEPDYSGQGNTPVMTSTTQRIGNPPHTIII